MSKKRIALTDNSGRWFSPDSAKFYDEAKNYDGNNMISQATGSQTEHEALYRTNGGRFILNEWSDHQGSTASYSEVSNEAAAKWFAINDYDPHKSCEKEFNDLEIK